MVDRPTGTVQQPLQTALEDLKSVRTWASSLHSTVVGADGAAFRIERTIATISNNDTLAPNTLASNSKLAYTISEAVKASGIGRTSLYEDIAAGRLETRRRGRRTIILATELNRYLNDLPVGREME